MGGEVIAWEYGKTRPNYTTDSRTWLPIDVPNDAQVVVVDSATFSNRFCGHQRDLISFIKESHPNQITVIDWVCFEDDVKQNDDSSDSSSDSDADQMLSSGLPGGRSTESLCSWFMSRGKGTILLACVSVPRKAEEFVDRVVRGRLEDPCQSATLATPKDGKRKVILFTGRFKTTRLRSATSLNPSPIFWIYPEWVVEGALGESQKKIRTVFASGDRIAFDDCDLFFACSGRIVKDILGEICSCIDQPGGDFFLAAESLESLPSDLRTRVTLVDQV